MTKSLVVHLKIKPEHFEEFLSIAKAHGENSVAIEKGCLRFEIMIPEDDPDKIILVEVYCDQAAIDAHLGSAHMAEYLRKTGSMIADRNRIQCTMDRVTGK